jgi:alpha-L-fucosidase
MLLNFPIMPNGLIHPTDEKNGIEFAKAVKESFAVNLALNKKAKATNVHGKSKKFGAAMAVDGKINTYWATEDNTKTASLTIDLGKPTLFNRFLVQEYIRLGQRVKAFTVEAFVDGKWIEVAKATTIGYKRILRFPSVKATQVRFSITDSKCSPVISNIGIYDAPVFLSTPSIARNQSGEVTITTNDIGPIFYYTLDGTEPTLNSKKYTGSFVADGKVVVKAISYDPTLGKNSPVGQEKFDISKKDWKLVGIIDNQAAAILDGDPSSVWHQSDKKMPIDLVIDLGNEYNISGFKYLPDQNKWSFGIITNYKFYVSADSKEWKLVSEGEFSNIKNNPLMQIKNFTLVMARYIKLCALKNTVGDDVAGYAMVDVITN